MGNSQVIGILGKARSCFGPPSNGVGHYTTTLRLLLIGVAICFIDFGGSVFLPTSRGPRVFAAFCYASLLWGSAPISFVLVVCFLSVLSTFSVCQFSCHKQQPFLPWPVFCYIHLFRMSVPSHLLASSVASEIPFISSFS